MPAVPWLTRAGDLLAPVEVATTVAARTRGLLGRDGIDGALLLRPAASVHSLGMRFAIDIAYCDHDLVVLEVGGLVPWRMGRPRRGCRSIIEAEAGAFDRWSLRPGDRLEVRA